MTPPRIACIMLVDGREEMVKRARAAFRAQTASSQHAIYEFPSTPWSPYGIPEMRNEAVGQVIKHAPECTHIAHWDSDDWSHPNRLQFQADAIMRRGCDITGFNSMVFWDSRRQPNAARVYSAGHEGAIVGTSLVYSIEAWKRIPFQVVDGPNKGEGEDGRFVRAHRAAGSKIATYPGFDSQTEEPLMIAHIHGENTRSAYDTLKIAMAKEWRREPKYDQFCKERMTL